MLGQVKADYSRMNAKSNISPQLEQLFLSTQTLHKGQVAVDHIKAQPNPTKCLSLPIDRYKYYGLHLYFFLLEISPIMFE